MLLVSGASADVARTDPARVGVLLQPGGNTRMGLIRDRVWAVDNGAFAGFDEDAFTDLLYRVRDVPGCQFVACPDVVGNAEATFDLFQQWAPRLRDRGFPLAFVAQDGCQVLDVPWRSIAALFIGGTTDWKLSAEVDQLLDAAKVAGVWRHVGRVNSRRRMRHFYDRCESIDGSGFSRFPKRIWLALDWRRQFDEQPSLSAVSPLSA